MTREDYYKEKQMDKIQHGIEQLTSKVIDFHAKHEERSNHILKEVEIIKKDREIIMSNKNRLTTHSIVGALMTSILAKILFWNE